MGGHRWEAVTVAARCWPLDLFWLSDSQWAAVRPLIPRMSMAPRRLSDRRVVSGIVHVVIADLRWRDCPRAYGHYLTLHNRYLRWKRQRLWRPLAVMLATRQGGPEEFTVQAKVRLLSSALRG